MEEVSTEDVAVKKEENGVDKFNVAGAVVAHVVEEKPIVALFREIIKKSKKVVLSNDQIIALIRAEFDIDTDALHPLVRDVYIDVTKHFLLAWKKWNKFDQAVTKLKANNDQAAIEGLLKVKHLEVRDYIKKMLDHTRPMAEEAAENIEEYREKYKARLESPDTRDIVMQVECTRRRLNELFYRSPNPEKDNSIFNLDPLKTPTKTPNPPTYQAIFNWWKVTIHLSFNNLHIRRETKHELTHKLVNRKNGQTTYHSPLDTRLQEKRTKKDRRVKKNSLIKCLENIQKSAQDTEMKNDINVIFEFVKEDLKNCISKILLRKDYRQYLSEYPYVRYGSVDVPNEDEESAAKFDLSLEETISPICSYKVSRYDPNVPAAKQPNKSMEILFQTKVSVKCDYCQLKFKGVGLLKSMQQHFWEEHSPEENDWQCTKCKQQFKVAALTNAKWKHQCEEKEKQA